MTLPARFTELCQDPRWAPHVRRYVESMGVVERIHPGGLIVDVGGESPFTAVLRERYPEVLSTGTADVRGHDVLPGCTLGSACLVTCLEVIEHIKDPAEADREVWTGAGVRGLLAAIWRTLRADGLLVLSTPNLCGWISVLNVLRGRHPFMWAPHPREFAPRDIRALLVEAGLAVVEMFTRPVWNRHGLTDAEARRLGKAVRPWADVDASMREDCLFVVASKVAA